MGQKMHRISNKLAAWQEAETEANKLGKKNEAVIAGTVIEVLQQALKADEATGWDHFNVVLESACKEAGNPTIRNSARQRGLFRAISDLQEVLPRLLDTRFIGGDLAEIAPVALKSPA